MAVKEGFSVIDSPAAPFLGNARRPTSSSANPRRRLLIGSAALAFLVLVINIGLLAWTAFKFKVQDGAATVYSGGLSKVRTISTWSHLGINILSTLLLAASNSCMQRLCAPTRAEVDAAHREGRWLDIGLLGFRNFSSISAPRIWLWFALSISTIPLHLLYNSVIFEISAANDYVIATVAADFFSADAYWNQTLWETWPLEQSADLSPLAKFQKDPSSLVRLDNKECIKAYARYLVASSRTVFLVSNITAQHDSVYGVTVYETLTSNPVESSYKTFCVGQNDYGNVCDVNAAIAASDKWTTVGILANGGSLGHNTINVQIEYCMVEPTEAISSIGINMSLLAVVIVCNLVKLVCFLIAFKVVTKKSLVTIGDAIVSFLEDPDPTTRGCSTLSKQDATTGRWKPGLFCSNDPVAPLPWPGKRHFWFRGASIRRWVICSTLVLLILIVGVIILLIGMHSIAGEETDPGGYTLPWSTLTGMGFGVIGDGNQLSFSQNPSLVSALLIANLPQLAVTGLYFMYNSLFTCMLTAKEWTDFSDRPCRLRVSEPMKGTRQRGTMYLQLPYQYSVPIMTASAAVHWLLSQSIFVAQVRIKGLEDFNIDPSRTFTGLGWSPLPIIAVLALGGAMTVALWLLGFRMYNGKMPLVGSCSVAISAACRRREDDEDITAKDIMWGIIGVDEDGSRYAGFSSETVEPLVPGEIYH